MAQQYIGARISLISKSDIRYRGVLHSIDPAASTVSLEQVRSMGTEGRKSNPAEEIAPTDTLYEFIVFRAADVKDLSIEAPAEPKLEPPKPSVPDDPAIMSTTAPPRHTSVANPYMAQHPMHAAQGMYGNMPPMMYGPGPGGMPPQWPPYGMPPPPGQMHPMMAFPPHPLQPALPALQPPGPSSSPPKPAGPAVSSSDRPGSQPKTTPLPVHAALATKPARTSTPSSASAPAPPSVASGRGKSPAPVNGAATRSVFTPEVKKAPLPGATNVAQTAAVGTASSGRTQGTTNGAKQPTNTAHPRPPSPQRHPLPQAPKHNVQQQQQIQAQAPDFDFASSNAKFPDGPRQDDFIIPEAPPGTYYDKKKSFFDDISSEVKERSGEPSNRGGGGGGGVGGGSSGGRGRGGRGWDRNAERQKNVDTFGDVALNPNLGALGSGYNGYGRGGANRMGGGGALRGMMGRGGGRGGPFQPRGMARGGMPFHRS